MKQVTVEEFQSLLKAQGVPYDSMCLVCPMCGTVQCADDLIAVGVGKTFEDVGKYLGFSCVGRWTHHKPPPKDKGTQDGCNWTLGGLFTCHTMVVVTPDGVKHPHFEPATPEQAKAHLEAASKRKVS